MITDVACRIVPRLSAEGHPCAEIFHTWKEDGVERHALSRVRDLVTDTPHSRAYHNQLFTKRRSR